MCVVNYSDLALHNCAPRHLFVGKATQSRAHPSSSTWRVPPRTPSLKRSYRRATVSPSSPMPVSASSSLPPPIHLSPLPAPRCHRSPAPHCIRCPCTSARRTVPHRQGAAPPPQHRVFRKTNQGKTPFRALHAAVRATAQPARPRGGPSAWRRGSGAPHGGGGASPNAVIRRLGRSARRAVAQRAVMERSVCARGCSDLLPACLPACLSLEGRVPRAARTDSGRGTCPATLGRGGGAAQRGSGSGSGSGVALPAVGAAVWRS